MRCVACDALLKDEELHLKDERGYFLDLCSNCYQGDVQMLYDVYDVEEAQMVGVITNTGQIVEDPLGKIEECIEGEMIVEPLCYPHSGDDPLTLSEVLHG